MPQATAGRSARESASLTLPRRPERLRQRRREIQRQQLPVARDDHQHDDRRDVGQRRQQFRRPGYAQHLALQLQDRHAAEQPCAEQHAIGPPRREHDQRQRDPAAASRHVLHPERRVDHREIGAGQSGHGAAEQHGEIADPDHGIADRMRGFRRFTDRAQHQPGLGAVEEPAGEDHHEQR